MGLFTRKRKDDQTPQPIPKESLSWEELQERAKKIEFNFRLGKRSLNVSNAQVKILSLCFVMFVFGAYFNNAFHWLFFSSKKTQQQEVVSTSPTHPKIEINRENKSTIEYEQQELEKAQRRLNQKKKRIAIDSLIDNDVFTRENLEAINKLYPDSVCGC